MSSKTNNSLREAATRRIHEDLGLKRLSPVWAKVEILLGLAAVSAGLLCGVSAVVHSSGSAFWLLAAASVALQTLGGYLAMAGHRSHLYQSHNMLAGWLANQISPPPQ
jgi:hypothetical protein